MKSLDDLVNVNGFSGKLVRAICRDRGWRYVAGQPPEEWYAAWRSTIGGDLEEIAIRRTA